jgi:sugar phosphate isomerase/epimerase
MHNQSTRRQFIGAAATVISGLAISSNKLFGAPALIRSLGDKPNSRINGVQIGTITYSFRDMPDQRADATLQYVLDSGISAIELMGGPAEMFAGAPKNPVNMQAVFPLMRKRRENQPLTDDEQKQLAEADAQTKAYRTELANWRLSAPMDKFDQLRKQYNQAGVTIYGFKPDAFGMNSSDAEINYGMQAAKRLGANQVTLEHPGNDAHTLKLGKLAEKNGIRVAYHGHEQQTPTFWDTALAQSPANAINFDLGHYIAAGQPDPLGFIREHHTRIASMHIKDRQGPDHGKGNLPWGQGDTPLKQVLTLLREQKYAFPATVELEYKVPEGSTSVAEVKKCLAYCRSLLA